MTTSHICTCEEQPCTCGRPLGRQGNAAMMSESGRLGQLEMLYRQGGPPTAEDIAFLSTGIRRTQNFGTAGRLLQGFGERGQVDGYTPRPARRGTA